MPKIVSLTEMQDDVEATLDWTTFQDELIITDQAGQPQLVVLPFADYQAYLDYKQIGSVETERTARRRANRWLVEQVGNMVMADLPRLIHLKQRMILRFGAYVTGSTHPPLGPIGYVDVEATTMAVLTDLDQAQAMIQQGQRVEEPPFLSPES